MKNRESCCRWCRHFNNGHCGNEEAFEKRGADILRIVEEGFILEAIREGFGGEDYSGEVAESIEEMVMHTLMETLEAGVGVADPYDFCCKHFL